jgi:hypothetical protein
LIFASFLFYIKQKYRRKTMQKIDAELVEVDGFGGRVETGALQINDDWPGIFIRGDDAFHFAYHLEAILKNPDDFIAKTTVQQLADLFNSCILGHLKDEIDHGNLGE